MKKYWIAVLAFLLAASSFGTAEAAVKIPAVYVALGDSLAAGQTPDSQIDVGYADLIAQELSQNQPLALFTKDLAYPGFTTGDVLERINEDEAQELLASANIITLSAGANDLLRLVQSNPAEGSLSFQQIRADFALNKARQNIKEILHQLDGKSPNADIYVMGYYFAYPHARDSQKEGTAKQLDRLNEILKQEAEQAGAVFVSVDESFGDDAVEKVPNPGDVHPNVKGYQAMANAFLNEYQKGWKVDGRELPEPNPLSFEEIMQNQEQQDPAKGQSDEAEETEDSIEEEADNGDSAALPSEKMETDYLALQEILPIV